MNLKQAWNLFMAILSVSGMLGAMFMTGWVVGYDRAKTEYVLEYNDCNEVKQQLLPEIKCGEGNTYKSNITREWCGNSN